MVENHGVPTPHGVTMDPDHRKWFQRSMNISEYYAEYEKHGYALFNRDFHGKAVDLAFIKLDDDFWKKDEGLIKI